MQDYSRFGLNRPFSCFLAVLLLGTCVAVVSSSAARGQEKQATKHDEKPHTNALVNESSPYLLAHAHNPVDWFPWNDESLAKAKAEGKPIFLSVGYSSCHWCHVMENESFLDEEIAKFLNENFICIKVDREERPDVDEIYMESLQVLNRMMRNGKGGGWPLSMFLTPDTKPFFGGTYFPARDGDRLGSPGFLGMIKKLDDAWKNQKEAIEKNAEAITEITRAQLEGKSENLPTAIQSRWAKETLDALSQTYDSEFGGFGYTAANSNRPKFPEGSNLLFLLHLAKQPGLDTSDQAKQMLVKTLQRIHTGGIYDHLGGGFHRYSVDRFWKIPHFEKMLYDNAQLVTIYAEAWELDKDPTFKLAVDGTLEFVKREMTTKEGGFYSALDADSEGEEGKFYRWEKKEIEEALTDDEFALFAKVYSIDKAPNFEDEYYAPQLETPFASVAAQMELSVDQLEDKLVPIRKKLFDIRARRVRPLMDSKILTEWNGMMIRAFADAGRIFKNADYTQTAVNAAEFALSKLRREDGRLWRTFTKNEAKLNAYLTDYAQLIDGLIALHRTTGEQRWIQAAEKLQHKQNDLFSDDANGGYFYTASDHQTLLIRTKRAIDNAVPSGTSVSAGNLLYLGQKLNKPQYIELAKKTVLSAGNLLDAIPLAAPRLTAVADQIKKLE
jgi:uncharacterized protein YyaL (SSP411 family)